MIQKAVDGLNLVQGRRPDHNSNDPRVLANALVSLHTSVHLKSDLADTERPGTRKSIYYGVNFP